VKLLLALPAAALSLALFGCAKTRREAPASVSASPVSVSAPAVAPLAGPRTISGLTPEQVGRRAIQGILREEPVDSLARYFEDSVRTQLTPENLEGYRGQIGWLPRFIGDSLDLLVAGTEVLDSTGRTGYFREYRFAAETAKRAPLMVMHVMFADSLTPEISGVFNKVFDNDTKNRLINAELWEIAGDTIDVHSVSYLEFKDGLLPLVRIYDADTTTLDSVRFLAKGAPVVREAIRRGYLKKVRDEAKGRPVIDRVAVALIRMDNRRGYNQYTYALSPGEYTLASDLKSRPAQKKTAPAKKTTTKKK
jgi:hypothetical protein